MLKTAFVDFLFSKGYLVHIPASSEKEKKDADTEALCAAISLAKIFDIRVDKIELACEEHIHIAAANIGRYVPEAFYQGFPYIVRNLTREQLTFDQLVHYTVTYGFGNFSQAGHSLFEEQFERVAFHEDVETKKFVILTVS